MRVSRYLSSHKELIHQANVHASDRLASSEPNSSGQCSWSTILLVSCHVPPPNRQTDTHTHTHAQFFLAFTSDSFDKLTAHFLNKRILIANNSNCQVFNEQYNSRCDKETLSIICLWEAGAVGLGVGQTIWLQNCHFWTLLSGLGH